MALAVDTAAGLLYRVVYVVVSLACANAVCEPLKATFLTNSLQVYISHSVFCNVIVSASGRRYTAGAVDIRDVRQLCVFHQSAGGNR